MSPTAWRVPNCANPSIGQCDLNDDQPDLRRFCRSLPVFIPVGKPRLPDISDQDTRAAINLSQQPQNTLVIATGIVADMIQKGDKGPGWNRSCQRLRHREQAPLSITSQGKRLATLGPTDHNRFSILPPSPVFDRQSRLADRRRCCDLRREALQIRRKRHRVRSRRGKRIGPRKPQLLLKNF